MVPLALALGGCFHAQLVAQERHALIAEALSRHLFPGPVELTRGEVLEMRRAQCEEVLAERDRRALLSHGQMPPVPPDFVAQCTALPVDELREGRWHFCSNGGCCGTLEAATDGFRLTEVSSSNTGLLVTDVTATNAGRIECLESMWAQLDRRSFLEAQDAAVANAERRTAEFEDRFDGPWGLTGAAFFDLQPAPLGYGVGGYAGLRKWVSPYLVPALAAGYERFLGPAPEDILFLRPRLEIATWTPEVERRAYPSWSIYLFAAPQLILQQGAASGGFEAGVGAHALYIQLELAGATNQGAASFHLVVGLGL